jgi:hypothetical protein
MAMAVLLRVLENFQGDGEFRSKRRTKTERRSNASFGLTYVEVFHLVLARSTCHSAHLLSLLNSEEKVGKVVPAITRSTAGNPMPPKPPLMKPDTGSKSTLAATLPHCRGKLGLKRLE